ncbi:MAG TPA: hypothetical protein PKW49_07940 [Paludibacteraceae bacterium]|jgi:hypothetical protein|nr:hypothetical protein [Paludibacteraceae bacterium]
MEEFILSAIFLACLFGIIILFAEVVSGVLSDGYDYHRDMEEMDEDEDEDWHN